MEFSSAELIFLLILFAAFVVQGITGFAGNILAMPFGMSMIGFDVAKSVINVVAIFNCGILTYKTRKSVNWRQCAIMLGIMIVFMFVGIWMASVMSMDSLKLIFGIVAFVVGAKNLIWNKKITLPKYFLYLVVAGAGILQGMYLCGGVLLVIYAMQCLEDKDEFRGTLAVVWTVLNLIYFTQALITGSITFAAVKLLPIAIPLVIAATFIGNKIAGKVSIENFKKLTYVVLLLIGICMIFFS